MPKLVLILEDEDTIYQHECGSTDDLTDLLLTIDLKKYCRKNILFYADDELNYPISKMYTKRYLN